MGQRVEKDDLGEVEVPEDAYYGVHSVRASRNFPVSRFRVHPELICSLGQVKQACAMANVEIGLLPKRLGDAITAAASELAAGKFLDQIVVDPYQGGAGTSTNMNVNEVIANRAIELLGGKRGDYSIVHPIDHVNLSQSTNDVYPTALRVAAIRLARRLSQSLAGLQGALQAKEREFASVLKIGRTELQDAVPITLGQEFGAWAEAIARDWWRIYKVEERLRQVNLGGTAVGTGLNASRRYIRIVIERLREISGIGLARAENTVEATQNADHFAEVSGFIKTAAVNLSKIAGDLRFLSSGPGAGLGEIRLPSLQAGSSIMPGKVNPVMPEMMTQVAYQVMANDFAISLAASAGQLELNAFLPLIAHNLLHSMELLSNAASLLAERCVLGIEADAGRCRENLHKSYGAATALVPYIGYEKACEIVRKARSAGCTIEEVLRQEGVMDEEQIQAIFRPEELTSPGVAGVRAMIRRKGQSNMGQTDKSQTGRSHTAKDLTGGGANPNEP